MSSLPSVAVVPAGGVGARIGLEIPKTVDLGNRESGDYSKVGGVLERFGTGRGGVQSEASATSRSAVSRRGLKAADSELKLASTVANLFKLHKACLA